jgi:hypothetical protein
MKKDFENLCSAAIKESHDQSIHRPLTRFFPVRKTQLTERTMPGRVDHVPASDLPSVENNTQGSTIAAHAK